MYVWPISNDDTEVEEVKSFLSKTTIVKLFRDNHSLIDLGSSVSPVSLGENMRVTGVQEVSGPSKVG